MGVATIDDIINRISNNYTLFQPIWQEMQGTAINNNNLSVHRCGISKALPSLPSGVTSYIPTSVSLISSSNVQTYLVARMINLGDLNIATPTFTDGSSMGTQTCLGATVNLASAILFEVTTALNATPGSITITYVDQDGNTAEAGGAFTLPASGPIRTCSWYPLNSPDWGVRDVTTATRTGGTTPTGVVRIWGMDPICMVTALGSGGVCESLLMNDFMWQEMAATDVVGVFHVGSTAAKATMGMIHWVGDS